MGGRTGGGRGTGKGKYNCYIIHCNTCTLNAVFEKRFGDVF